MPDQQPPKLRTVIPPWDPTKPLESLDRYHEVLQAESSKSIKWYDDHKKQPAFGARIVRWAAILTSAVGGLFPIWVKFLMPGESADLGYPLLAIAAALIAVDRFGGASAAWMRYVTTMQTIEREQRSLRHDWIVLRHTAALLPEPLKAADLKPLFDRLGAFAAKHDDIVEAETRTWIIEFRSALAELGRSGKKEETPAPAEVKQQPASTPPPPAEGVIDLTLEGDPVEGDILVTVDGVQKPTRGMHLTIAAKPGRKKIVAASQVDGQPVTWETEEIEVTPGATVAAVAKRK
jgi:SMODS and SLOG-associating 2TM effector domain 2